MSEIQQLLDLLKSDNHNKRYEACEQFRIWKQPLPQEAIDALTVTTKDINSDVADAARRALSFHSQVDNEEEQRQELDASSLDKSSKTNLPTAIGIGFLVGFIGTLSLISLMIYGSKDITFLVDGAIGGVFGVLGSVIGYALIGSKRAVWIGAILGTILIPCYFFVALLGGAG